MCPIANSGHHIKIPIGNIEKMPYSGKIIVLSEQLRGQSFELGEQSYSIGRTEKCEICVPDPTISQHHCTLVPNESGGFAVQDNGSTNGTRVNGKRVDREDLFHSDIIQIGGVELLYESEQKRTAEEPVTTARQTHLNIRGTAGTSRISETPNISPFGPNAGKHKKKRSHPLLLASIAIAAIAVAAIVIFLIIKSTRG